MVLSATEWETSPFTTPLLTALSRLPGLNKLHFSVEVSLELCDFRGRSWCQPPIGILDVVWDTWTRSRWDKLAEKSLEEFGITVQVPDIEATSSHHRFRKFIADVKSLIGRDGMKEEVRVFERGRSFRDIQGVIVGIGELRLSGRLYTGFALEVGFCYLDVDEGVESSCG